MRETRRAGGAAILRDPARLYDGGRAAGLVHNRGVPDVPLVSVVMPCLNEAETLERCVTRALDAIREAGLSGEVIVADNGSTDGSQEIARKAGARVVTVPERGYGAALRGGIAEAEGGWV